MCNFFSAVVVHNGNGSVDIFHCLGEPDGMSHRVISERHNLNPETDHVAKVEYLPFDGVFFLDEDWEPIWWDEDIKMCVVEKIQDILAGWLRPGWEWCSDGQCVRNSEGRYHCGHGPAKVNAEGGESWWLNGQCHREDGPAVVAAGIIEWWMNGKRHKEDGPAVVWAFGQEEWFLDGNLHRLDGPAITTASYRAWYRNGKIHREDGPAFIWTDGTQEWWVHGKRHRDDGPAIEYPSGSEEWWIDGYKRENPGEITMSQIEGK